MARVLLVDDDPTGLELRQLILERHQHTVHTATSAEAAREIRAETNADIIVLDLRLPDAADGLALIRHFKTQSPDIRIVVLCGWPQDLENQPEAALVDAVLSKPAHTAKLLQAIAGC